MSCCLKPGKRRRGANRKGGAEVEATSRKRLRCERYSGEERKTERGLLGPRKQPQLVNGVKALKVKPTGFKATRDAKKPIRSLATLIIKL